MASRNLQRMDLNLFIVFEAIYDQGSITRAAEVLNVTQPAVSNNIARLRELFNDPLFIRVGKGISPTPIAHDLIGPVRQALQTFDSTFKRLDTFDPKTSDRTISVSMGDLSEVIFLTPLANKIDQLDSNIAVQNLLVPRSQLHEKLASGEIDLAIEPELLAEPSLHSQLLLQDEFVCVVRKGHSLAKKQLSLETYLALGHLNISNRPHGANPVDKALSKLNQRRRVAVRVQHSLVARDLLKDSDLSLTVPRRFVSQILGDKDFHCLDLPFVVPPLEYWLYWHTVAGENSANRWARDLMIELNFS